MSANELCTRALARYRRTPNAERAGRRSTTCFALHGRRYVMIESNTSVLALFRVGARGQLRRVNRTPVGFDLVPDLVPGASWQP